MTKPNRKICIAPMMTHTDRHFRYFLRLISKNVMLYTEMVTTGALIHGNSENYLNFNPAEHPLALQLGGNDSRDLSRCAIMAEDAGFDEINLNIGCPSDRVQSGKFGACLMLEPGLVADCVASMQASVKIPVTVKCRTGVDNHDSYEELSYFIELISAAGCKTVIIHARKALLNGLSPRQNREVPPLKYEVVHQIKRDFPQLEIIINGGFNGIRQIVDQLSYVDGVMIGRVVCNNSYILADIESEIFKNRDLAKKRHEILELYAVYISAELKQGAPLSHLTRNILGFYHGQPGAREYRRFLSENIYNRKKGVEIIGEALQRINTSLILP